LSAEDITLEGGLLALDEVRKGEVLLLLDCKGKGLSGEKKDYGKGDQRFFDH
jgi:hypothetical protein